MVFVKEAKELRFVRFNKAGEDLLGIPRSEMLGKNDHDFFPKKQADFFTAKDRKVLESGEVLDIPEEPIESPNGKHWLHTKKVPLMGDDGRPAYLLGISEDITLRRELNQEKDNLIGIASHELRSPANAIVGSLSILQEILKDYEGKDAKESIELALENAERLVHVLDDCLNLERLASNQDELITEKLDLATIVRDAVRLNAPYAERLATRFEFGDMLETAPIRGDRIKLIQALTNLMTNAAKFSKKGSAVVLSLTKNGKFFLVSIEDRGPGIPKEFQPRLFEKFSRSRSKETVIMEGSGLGLTITKKILERLGGRIGFRSEIEKGTTFYFTLPKL